MTHLCKICNAVPAGVLHACVGQPSVDPAAWAKSAAAFGAKPVDYAEAKRLCEERINEIVQLKAKVEELTDDRYHLRNLLAIIYGDGGDYTGKHGTKKATDDAIGVVCDLRGKVEELTKLWDAERNRADEAERDMLTDANLLKEQIAHVNRLTDENDRLREFWRCFKQTDPGIAANGSVYSIVDGKQVRDAWLAAKPKGEA